MAEQGLWYPTVVTSAIAVVLSISAFHSLSGAGVIRGLPLTRLALLVIAAIFILREVSFVGLMPMIQENSQSDLDGIMSAGRVLAKMRDTMLSALEPGMITAELIYPRNMNTPSL